MSPSAAPLHGSSPALSSEAFSDIPPFPIDIPTAPLLRISLRKLLEGDKEEEERCWRACCIVGFFYIDLRSGKAIKHKGAVEEANKVDVKWEDGVGDGGQADGESLLKHANELFEVMKEFFNLEVTEKQKYDFLEQGSYFGYKGYGAGIVDKAGMRDRNEFYNISKNSTLSLPGYSSLPEPAVLIPHNPLLARFTTTSHALCTLLLTLLSPRLGLPPNYLPTLHRLSALSGDQIRFVRTPPQPAEEAPKPALGAHTDFGSVTILFNRVGGLQVQLPHGVKPEFGGGMEMDDEAFRTWQSERFPGMDRWAYVRPLPGHAIVNLGDALALFSAGILRSNIHRVVPPPGAQGGCERFSLVYFSRPEDGVLLRALREGSVVDEVVKVREARGKWREEEAVRSEDWVLRRALGRRRVGGWLDSGGTEGGV
ncbi:Clavaminate synthase-like protein [Lepidopterella palustris CBS 459.81]|uniref:Clavaminate synthase-like protein n=1 Tax=Lepidopterella palustris CBS 459.81 TaxID=1314670 RepID=A0A8E2EKQ7_9PEZI|nr:Clavaminate synthase-like protein [Lepidopterella palustris CBS 459.81]